MMDSVSSATALAVDDATLDEEFALNVRVVEATRPVANLLLSTSDDCGNTCEDGADACLSFIADPS